MHISRRKFAQLAGTAAAAHLPIHGAGTLTAEAVIERIKSSLGGDWPSTGLDGIKSGDPATQVKGIATTAMATMDVLKRAVKSGSNFVISYEPTFYGRLDGAQPPPPPAPPPGAATSNRPPVRGPLGLTPDDPVYRAKKEFIEKNGLVVFRLHEHWKARKEGDMTAGLADALGWAKFRLKPDDAIYAIPEATAENVVADIRKKLNLRGGLRAVGDRKAVVKRVMLYPGTMTPALMWERYADADLMITGEVREWENTFYAADMFTAGEKRGLVTLGRIASEDPGMRACAAWLKGVIKEVQSQCIPAGDLYWRAV